MNVDDDDVKWEVGEKVLALDRTNMWYPAKIMAMKKPDKSSKHGSGKDTRGGEENKAANKYKIHFENWSKSHDIWVTPLQRRVKSRGSKLSTSENVQHDDFCFTCGHVDQPSHLIHCAVCHVSIHKSCLPKDTPTSPFYCGLYTMCFDPTAKVKHIGPLTEAIRHERINPAKNKSSKSNVGEEGSSDGDSDGDSDGGDAPPSKRPKRAEGSGSRNKVTATTKRSTKKGSSSSSTGSSTPTTKSKSRSKAARESRTNREGVGSNSKRETSGTPTTSRRASRGSVSSRTNSNTTSTNNTSTPSNSRTSKPSSTSSQTTENDSSDERPQDVADVGDMAGMTRAHESYVEGVRAKLASTPHKKFEFAFKHSQFSVKIQGKTARESAILFKTFVGALDGMTPTEQDYAKAVIAQHVCRALELSQKGSTVLGIMHLTKASMGFSGTIFAPQSTLASLTVDAMNGFYQHREPAQSHTLAIVVWTAVKDLVVVGAPTLLSTSLDVGSNAHSTNTKPNTKPNSSDSKTSTSARNKPAPRLSSATTPKPKGQPPSNPPPSSSSKRKSSSARRSTQLPLILPSCHTPQQSPPTTTPTTPTTPTTTSATSATTRPATSTTVSSSSSRLQRSPSDYRAIKHAIALSELFESRSQSARFKAVDTPSRSQQQAKKGGQMVALNVDTHLSALKGCTVTATRPGRRVVTGTVVGLFPLDDMVEILFDDDVRETMLRETAIHNINKRISALNRQHRRRRLSPDLVMSDVAMSQGSSSHNNPQNPTDSHANNSSHGTNLSGDHGGNGGNDYDDDADDGADDGAEGLDSQWHVAGDMSRLTPKAIDEMKDVSKLQALLKKAVCEIGSLEEELTAVHTTNTSLRTDISIFEEALKGIQELHGLTKKMFTMVPKPRHPPSSSK